MRRRFKDKTMQATYDDMVCLPDDAVAKVLRRGSSQDSAFAAGFEGCPQIGVRDYRRTWAYAAWCAGKDHPKAHKGADRASD